MTKELYIRGKFRNFHEMLELANKALEDGVKEVHLGYTRCAFCGAEIESEIQGMAMGGKLGEEKQITVHLCDSCYKETMKNNSFKPIGKG